MGIEAGSSSSFPMVSFDCREARILIKPSEG